MIDQRAFPRAAGVLAIVVLGWTAAAAVTEGLPELDASTRNLVLPRLVDFLIAVTAVSLAWWVARRSRPLSSPLAVAAALLVGLALALVGVVPLAVLVLAAAPALLVARAFAGVIDSPAARLVLGLGVVAAAIGWLLPLPIFGPTATAVLLGAIALAGWKALGQELASWGGEFTAEPAIARAGLPGWAWVLAVLLGSMPAWLPHRNPDDLAFRVGLGFELLEYGHARFDVGTQVWALSPWNSEVLHALLTLLARGEASGPLGALWVVLTAWLARGIAIRLGAGPGAALWAGALYASLPITGFLAGGLQTEAMSAAVLAALVTVLLDHQAKAPERALVAAAVLSGVLLGVKVSNALLLLPIGLWLLARWWTGFPAKALPVACLAGFLSGGASYTYAWLLTGNPVLPVMNGIFKSPWFAPVNFVDPTWQTGLPWTLPWTMLVDSSKYFEGISGAAGLVPIFILALLPIAVARPRVRVAALVGLAGFMIVMSQVQYLRYAHPVLVLVIPAFVAGLSDGRWMRLALAAAVLVQCALLPTASWMFMHGIVRDRVTAGREAVLERYAPERLLAEDFKAIASPSDRLLMTDPLRGFVALLPGRAVGANWHNPRIETLRVVDWDAPGTWEKIVRETGANYAITQADNVPPALAGLVAGNPSAPIARRGHMQLVALRMDRSLPVRMQEIAAEGRTMLEAEVPAGFAWTGTMRIEVACNLPGEPVAAAWTLTKAGAPVAQLWEWLTCPQSGVLPVERDLELPAGAADRIQVSLARARPDASMAVSVLASNLELRRDLLSETDLADVILPEGCRGIACAVRGPRVLERPINLENHHE